MKFNSFLMVAALAFPFSGAALAQPVAAPAAAAPVDMVAGEVKKVNKDAGKVTIKHGPLTSLDMPPMTMVFRVKDPAMLDKVKAGDKIHFVAERANGAMTVTQIALAE